MRKAARVFLILGMIFQCYLIFPIVLGIFANRRLSTAKTSEELKGWGILSIFFISVLGGVFMLCVKDEELQENIVSIPRVETKENRKISLQYAGEKLMQLRKLYDDGIINLDEYNEKRKKYVEEL